MPKKEHVQAEITTAVATLVWPHLHAPDTRFDDPEDAKFKTEFTLSPEDAQPLIKQAKALIAQAKKEGKASAPPKAPYTKNDDGTYTFKCHSYNAPALFDAAGQPMEGGLKIGGGTKARLALLQRVYEGFGNTGITQYVNAVQILDLKTFGGSDRDAGGFGFDAREGFTASDTEELDDPFGNDEGDLEEAGGDDSEFDADF